MAQFNPPLGLASPRQALLALILGALSGHAVLAQDTPLREAEAAVSTETPTASDLEEVTVFGRRSLGSMRMELVKAQEQLYERFNAVIADPKYEIRCRRYTPTGTRRSQRVCETAYMQEALTRSAQTAFATGNVTAGGQLSMGMPMDPMPSITNGDRELVDKMVIAVNENPELRQAVLDFAEVQRRFIESRDERFLAED